MTPKRLLLFKIFLIVWSPILIFLILQFRRNDGSDKTPTTDDLVISTEKNEELSHKDLYGRNLTVIDIRNKFIINNDICNVRRIALVTIIHTAVDNHEARSMIRSAT